MLEVFLCSTVSFDAFGMARTRGLPVGTARLHEAAAARRAAHIRQSQLPPFLSFPSLKPQPPCRGTYRQQDGPRQGQDRRRVKKAARVSIEKYYTKLTLDFHTNKRIIVKVALIPSKPLRNKVGQLVVSWRRVSL